MATALRLLSYAALTVAVVVLAVAVVTWAITTRRAPSRALDAALTPAEPDYQPAASGCLCAVDCWTKPCRTYEKEHVYR
jgi:hypothetical protein